MSRLGKKPIKIPENVKVSIKDREIKIKGPESESAFVLPKKIEAKKRKNKIELTSPIKRKEDRTIYGLTRSNLKNSLIGAARRFKKKLEFSGVGYTAVMESNKIKLNLGYSNPIEIEKPQDLDVRIEKNTIEIRGNDKQKVGEFAAKIRGSRKVEPYKGKGIKYKDEHVRRKVGKAALKTEGEGESK